MRLRIATTLFAILLFCSATPLLQAQLVEGRPNTYPPEPICTTNAPLQIHLEACTWQLSPDQTYMVSGNVFFKMAQKRIYALSGRFNTVSEKGEMRDVSYTTCDKLNPDFHITARRIVILSRTRINAMGVSIYLGHTKVLTLPSLKFRLGNRQAETAIFPRPGYDKNDGFTISQALRLFDTTRNRTEADIRLTTNAGFQGQLFESYGLDGRPVDFPGRTLDYDSLRSNVLAMPQQPVNGSCDPQLLRPVGAARTRGFGQFTLKERTYDIRNDNLAVYRQPEMGVTYIDPQINLTNQRLDPRLEVHSMATASWGRFKEVPSTSGFIQRDYVNLLGALNILPLGPETTIQPIGMFTLAHYGNNDEYRTFAYAVDASHLFRTGSFISLRYIGRSASGTTPFLFDQIDILKEGQAAFLVQIHNDSVGLVSRYDFDTGALYEYEVLLERRTDCLRYGVRWNSRLKRFSIDLTMKNL